MRHQFKATGPSAGLVVDFRAHTPSWASDRVCSINLGVLTIRALLLTCGIRAPDVWKLPHDPDLRVHLVLKVNYELFRHDVFLLDNHGVAHAETFTDELGLISLYLGKTAFSVMFW